MKIWCSSAATTPHQHFLPVKVTAKITVKVKDKVNDFAHLTNCLCMTDKVRKNIFCGAFAQHSHTHKCVLTEATPELAKQKSDDISESSHRECITFLPSAWPPARLTRPSV